MQLRYFARLLLLAMAFGSVLHAQQMASKQSAEAGVPRLIRYGANLPDGAWREAAGAVGVLFSIYRDEYDGAPLWREVQQVERGPQGAYSVLLGSTRNEGLPLDIFTTAEPRWLEVEINGLKQPRVLLGSVPYAIAAANTETLGGLPASSYLRVNPATTSSYKTNLITAPIGIKPGIASGTNGYLAEFGANANQLINSALLQTGNAISIGGTTNLGAMTLTGTVSGGDAPGMALYNQGGGGGASVSVDIYNTSSNGGIPQAKIKAIDDGNYSDHLTLLTKVPGAPTNPLTEKLRITSGGNVGIGANNPAATLEVAGNMQVDGNLTLSGSAVIAFPDGTALASTPKTGNPMGIPNLSAVAQLRWGYITQTSFPTAVAPGALVFDGANIWASLYTIRHGVILSLLKIKAATGVTTSVTGIAGNYLAFDGANIWMSILFSAGTLYRLSGSTGAILNTYTTVGGGPMAFDGANMWVVGSTGVTKVRASDGTVLATYNIPGAAQNSQVTATGIAFDGTNIWAGQYFGAVEDSTNGVAKIRPSDGTVLATYQFPADASFSMIFDGVNIWADSLGNLVKIRASTGQITTYQCGTSTNSNPGAMAFDGTNMWLACGTNSLVKLSPSTGAILATYPIPVNGIAFDGSNIWVSSNTAVIKIGPSAR